MRFFVAGGGCYGTFYVKQLLSAKARGKISHISNITVLDCNPNCRTNLLYKNEPLYSFVQIKWEDAVSYFEKESINSVTDHWVPTPLGPHIAYHWVLSVLNPIKKVRLARPDLKTLGLPYEKWLDSTLILSHAPGMCPTHCVEPKLCPLTKANRDWEMKQTVESLGTSCLIFQCQHYVYGVGTIPFAQIQNNLDQAKKWLANPISPLAVATVSSCHGIVNYLECSENYG